MPSYKPSDFWEQSHSAVFSSKVNLGFGVRHVGGGQTDLEAEVLYQLRRINVNRVLAKFPLPPNPKIFELGSGGGYWVEFFRELKPSMFVGSDLSSTAVDRLAKLYPECEFATLAAPDAAWLRIQALGPFDLSLAVDVLYHITDNHAWAEALDRLCANTAASGLLLIADYFHEQPADQPSKIHVKHRTMQTYLDVLDRHNFKVEAIQPVFYFLNRIVDGPWRDHNRVLSPILRFLTSKALGLRLMASVDAMITAFLRPMNPRCKTRFLLARKAAGP